MVDHLEEQQEHQHLSVGERLRQAREAKSLSLEDLATQTRIPVRHLRSIEDGNWDALPAVTYSVGFARSYANAVGLDGAAIGREVRDQLGGNRPPAIAPEYYEPADPARVPPRALVIVAVVLAALLIAGYLIWRSSLTEPEAPSVAESETIRIEEAQPRPQAQPAPPPPATGQVTLVATDEVWFRVNDGSGAALFQGILQAGQTYDVPQTAQNPVLRTGRPQVLRVRIGGREIGALDTQERTVSNVSLLPSDLNARLSGQAGPAGTTPPGQ